MESVVNKKFQGTFSKIASIVGLFSKESILLLVYLHQSQLYYILFKNLSHILCLVSCVRD